MRKQSARETGVLLMSVSLPLGEQGFPTVFHDAEVKVNGAKVGLRLECAPAPAHQEELFV